MTSTPCLLAVVGALLCVMPFATKSFAAANAYSLPVSAMADDFSDDDAFDKCLKSAIATRGSCVLPQGTLILSMYPSALRQEVANGIVDLRGAMLRGQGERTVIKGVSPHGFDVLQLNGVANFSVQDLTITTQVTDGLRDSGVNGISMTNGTNNIKIGNVHVHDLPYVRKPDYIDGGKAFTVQAGSYNTTVPMRDIYIEQSSSRNVAVGFWLSANTNTTAEPENINVSGNSFEGDLAGIVFSFVRPVRPMHMFAAAVLNNAITGGKYGIVLSRGRDYRVEDNKVALRDDLYRNLGPEGATQDRRALQVSEVTSIRNERNTFQP